MAKRSKTKNRNIIISILTIVIFLTIAYQNEIKSFMKEPLIENHTYTLNDLPKYNGQAYVQINNNKPNFKEEDYNKETFETYSNLDYLNRAGTAFAKVGKETMPKEERGSIGMIKPSGWHTVKYDIVSGKYLYNRCHLIGYQLTGENANEKNLITCTRQTNVGAMLDFENKVAEYIKNTNNHV